MDREFANSYNDYVDNGNAWNNLNPLSKLAICLCIGLTAVIVRRWEYGFILCALYFVFAAAVGIFKKFVKSYFAISITVIILTILIRQIAPTEPRDTFMLSVFGWKWYWEPFRASLNIISYIMGFTGIMLIFFNTTEMRDIMLALEGLGISHVATYIMLSSMQSIIDLRSSATTILESQKSRGIETDGNALVRIKAFLPTMGPIFLSAMTGTEEKSIAMDARAFSAKGEHTFLRVLRPIPVWEYVLIGLSVLWLIAAIAWRVLRLMGKI